MDAHVPRHGVYRGYLKHRADDEEACDPCRVRTRGRPWRIAATRTPETIEKILSDYRKGIRMKDISARHGVSAETVRSLARAAGIGKREWPVKSCSACLNQMRVNPEGLCANCALDVPLEGGRWVLDPVRRIQVWEVSDVA